MQLRSFLGLLMVLLMILGVAACAPEGVEEEVPGEVSQEEEEEEEEEEAINDREEVSMIDMLMNAQAIQGMTFDYVVMHHEKGQEFSGSMWVQEHNERIRMDNTEGLVIEEMGGFDVQIVEYMVDHEAREYTIYLPNENKALSDQLPEADAVENPQKQAEGVSEEEAADAEYLGTQEIADTKCHGWRVSNFGNSAQETEMWLHHEYGLPMKIEIFQEGEVITTMEYTNLEVGELPADTFKLPASVELFDPQSLMMDGFLP